jgi:hypothetical protein
LEAFYFDLFQTVAYDISIVRRSKRMILILSEEFLVDSDIVKIAWNEAQEKIKDMRTNYAIVVWNASKHTNLSSSTLMNCLPSSFP